MTPDDVVARARELNDKDALLTLRVRIVDDSHGLRAIRPGPVSLAIQLGPDVEPWPDLVDIQPAPVRIEPNQFYLDAHGRLFRGLVGDDYAGCVVSVDNWDQKYGSCSIARPKLPEGLVRAKIVPA